LSLLSFLGTHSSRGALVAMELSWESTGALEGSCSQNTLKNRRLEHWNYRQENFIDRKRLSREMHSGVQKPGAP
jgi:hypothetical protein